MLASRRRCVSFAEKVCWLRGVENPGGHCAHYTRGVVMSLKTKSLVTEGTVGVDVPIPVYSSVYRGGVRDVS